MTKGEANQLVRSCNDKNGYTAWKKLYDRFNPKTPASLTAAWRDVIRPKKIRTCVRQERLSTRGKARLWS